MGKKYKKADRQGQALCRLEFYYVHCPHWFTSDQYARIHREINILQNKLNFHPTLDEEINARRETKYDRSV